MFTKPIEVVLEAPNFGFGPISSALMLARSLASELRCAIMSAGAALLQAKRSMPELDFIEAETFDASCWEAAKAALPREAIVVCNTNPHFAAWLAEHGVRVGVYDTLYWMWDELPPSIATVKFYAAQWYFGRSAKRSDPPFLPVTFTAPPCVPAEKADKPGRRALISFGGMALPTRQDFPLDYAVWMCGLLAPRLAAEGVEAEVIGARPDMYHALKGCGGVIVVEPLPGSVFLKRLVAARHLFMTPGLASIYEADALGLRPFWLPGYSLSMVSQARDYFERTGGATFGYVWPWADEALAACEGAPEAKAVAMVCDNAQATIKQRLADEPLLEAVERYFDRATAGPQLKRILPVLPEPSEVVADFVRHLKVA